MVQNNPETTFHLRDYLAIIRQRIWLVILTTFLVVAAVMLITLQTPKTYRSSAQVLIERESNQYVKLEEVLAVDASSNDYYQTQYKILHSKSLADRVIKELNLTKNIEFGPDAPKGLWGAKIQPIIGYAVDGVKGIIATIFSKKPLTDNADDQSNLISVRTKYLARLSIKPIQRSRLVIISFDAFNPDLAAKVANAHSQAYITRSLEIRFAASKEAVDWLTSKLDNLKKNLEGSEASLQTFQEKENIVALENNISNRGSDEENIQAQRLAELTSQLTRTRTEVIGLQTLYREMKDLSKTKGMVESLPQVINNSLIQKWKARLVELTEEYSELKEKYGEKHPRMVTVRSELKTVRQRIKSEVGKISKSVEIQYRMVVAKKNSLEKALNNAKKDALLLSKKAAKYRYLKREADTNRQLYQMVMQRAKEADLTSGLSSTNIHVVDKAEPANSAFGPKTKQRALLALIVGMMMGVGLAFLLHYMDNTLHSGEDVKKALGVPSLGATSYYNVSQNKKDPSSELIVLSQPRSDFAEGLRNVRTNISFSLIGDGPKVIVITSPVPGDGKTRITSNLAVTIAQTGQKVVLVDADLRRPRGHQIFNLRSKPGFTNVVAGQVSLSDVMMDVGVPGLKMIPAGSIPPNPSELLSSRQCRDVIDKIKAQADVVLIDTPPVIPFADPAILAGVTDGVILVVRGSGTTVDAARSAVGILQDVRANVLGVVLNWLDRNKELSYYKYYGYYNKGYSYRYRYEYQNKNVDND